MIKHDFGSAVGRFTETDGIAALTDNELCAFDFSGTRTLAITHISASFVDVSGAGFCGSSRVIVFQGFVQSLGLMAREGLTTDIEAKYGVKILHDTLGITDNWTIDVSGNPIVATLGQHLYILHLPPYAETDGQAFLDSVLSLSVNGFYPQSDEQEIIYPGYKLR